MHATDRADPPPSGPLKRGVERKCSRNAVHSSYAFVGAWLFWTPVRLKEVTQPSQRAAVKSGPRAFFQSSVKTNTTHISPYICLITFFGLCVCDLQVAVPGSELLPAHDLPLQLPQRDVRAVKNHRVRAEFRGEFIVNMSHAEIEKAKNKKPRPTLSKKPDNCHRFCDARDAVSRWLLWK